ncbi:MAG: hypothetical protein RIB98_17720 [Acidimicrobiales bacterium]
MVALHALADLVLIATKTTRAGEQDAWVEWLAPHAAAHDGALWRLLDPARPGLPGAGHSHVLHLPGDRTHDHDHAIATARNTDREAEDRQAVVFHHAEIQRDHWTRAGDGIVVDPPSGEADVEVSGLIIAHVLSTDPTRIDEWDDWYETRHLPDMMESGAFVAGTRWRRTKPRTGGANHMTIYETAGIGVDEAIQRSAAIMPGLIADGRKHECHAGGLTWALQRAGETGA